MGIRSSALITAFTIVGSSCFADVRWRIIETEYPTDDVVVAGFAMQDFGAKGDGVSDDTAAFQNALDAMAANRGGTVFAPEGRYAIKGTLEIPTGVALRGEWRKPRPIRPISGTILMAYAERGKADGKPFILLDFCSGVRELAIWYPEQKPDSIVLYPYTIKQNKGGPFTSDNATAENITLVNSYQGLETGPEPNELHYFKRVYTTALFHGIEIDMVSDIGRLEEVALSPDYWAWSRLPGAPAENGPHAKWMYEHGTGIILHRSDWQYASYVRIEGYHTGVRIVRGVDKRSAFPGANGQCYAVTIDRCRVGIDAIDVRPQSVAFTASTINADEYALKVDKQRNGVLMFHTSTLNGGVKSVENAGAAHVSFQHCAFGNTVSIAQGSATVVDSDFLFQGTHVSLGPAAASAAIVANRFSGAPNIKNRSRS